MIAALVLAVALAEAPLGASVGPCIEGVATLECQKALADAAITWRQRANDCLATKAPEPTAEPLPAWELALLLAGAAAVGAGLAALAMEVGR